MSQYSELRKLLKEDIEQIVEERLAERTTSLVTSIMPRIIEEVAKSLKVSAYDTDPGIREGIQVLHMSMMNSQTGCTHYIGSVDTINPNRYKQDLINIVSSYEELMRRINILESKNP